LGVIPANLDDVVARVVAQRDKTRAKLRQKYMNRTAEEKEKERLRKYAARRRRAKAARPCPVHLSQHEYECLMEIAKRHPNIKPFINVVVSTSY